jgi:hypothetical protein
VSEDPTQPEELAGPAEEDVSDALDENLAALAQAEADVEAVEARLAAGDGSLPHDAVVARLAAERRRRGHPAWGATSLILAAVGVGWPLVSGTLAEFLRRPGLRWNRGQIIETAILAGAVVLGTVGRRRPAGRRLALIGRFIALCVPPGAWVLFAAIRTYRGVADGDLVIASASALVWLACGLFGFATFDALLEP